MLRLQLVVDRNPFFIDKSEKWSFQNKFWKFGNEKFMFLYEKPREICHGILLNI